MRIFLIGYMGSGKSTLGPDLAKAMKLHFHDLDKIIEAEAWMSIKDIFRKQGEASFREKERSALQNFIANHDHFVMATGGGTPCYMDNMDRILNAGVAVYLEVEPLELFRRLQQQKADRPMIARLGDQALWTRIREHMAQRTEQYRRAQIVWDGTKRNYELLIQQIADLQPPTS